MTTLTQELPALKPQQVWRANYRGVEIEIKHWAFEHAIASFPDGNWNYYVYIQERMSPRFEEIWLPDEERSFSGSGRKYISHDYYRDPLGSVRMHGGITYYTKHGHTVGHRCVAIGCDYQHYGDKQRGYSEQYLLHDAIATIEDLYRLGIVSDAKATGQA